VNLKKNSKFFQELYSVYKNAPLKSKKLLLRFILESSWGLDNITTNISNIESILKQPELFESHIENIE